MNQLSERSRKSCVALERRANTCEFKPKHHSGFQFHPTIGLVSQRYQGLIDELTPMSGKPVH